MWFKHLHLYRVHTSDTLTLPLLNDALTGHRFRPVGPHDAARYGWSAPAGRDSDTLVHEVQGHRLIRLAEQKRLLPTAVINEVLEERAAEWEAKQGFSPRRRERQALKEAVIEELLPQAFARTTVTELWWDTQQRLIGINCASSKRAERVLDALRQSLGSLSVTPLAVRVPVARTMTGWLTDPSSRPDRLVIGDQIELRGSDDGVIRARAVDLNGDEIQAALASGRQASRLAIAIDGVLELTLQEDLALKSLAFDDALLDEASDTEDDNDAILRLETDFALMAQALSMAVRELIDWLGGELDPATASHS